MQYFARSTSYEESEPKADTKSSTSQTSYDLLDEETISDKDERDAKRQQTEDGEKERPRVDDTEEKGYIETSSEPHKMPEEVEADESHTEPASNRKQDR